MNQAVSEYMRAMQRRSARARWSALSPAERSAKMRAVRAAAVKKRKARPNQIQTREGTAARLGNDPTDPIVSLERYDCRHDREAWSWRAVLAVHGPIPAGWDETDRDETILRACEDSFGIRVQQETEGGPGGAFAEFPVVEYWPSVRDCRTIYVSQLGGLDV